MRSVFKDGNGVAVREEAWPPSDDGVLPLSIRSFFSWFYLLRLFLSPGIPTSRNHDLVRTYERTPRNPEPSPNQTYPIEVSCTVYTCNIAWNVSNLFRTSSAKYLVSSREHSKRCPGLGIK